MGPVKTDSRAVSGAAPYDDRESVILVDAGNNVVGSCGKLAAHRKGELHRAFSVLITNQDGELLLQRRAAGNWRKSSVLTYRSRR